MKNTIRIFAIIAAVAIIMVGMAGCIEKITYELKVVNNSSRPLSIKDMKISYVDEKPWSGVIQVGKTKNYTGSFEQVTGPGRSGYSFSYGIEGATSPMKQKYGEIRDYSTETVTITDADL